MSDQSTQISHATFKDIANIAATEVHQEDNRHNMKDYTNQYGSMAVTATCAIEGFDDSSMAVNQMLSKTSLAVDDSATKALTGCDQDLSHTDPIEETRQLDIALENEVKDESLLNAIDAVQAPKTAPNPYQFWECGFGFNGKLETPSAIPDTKAEFLKAVKGEVSTVSFIQNGLSSYIKAINSGEHHAFSEGFLRHQNNATHITIGQLFQITRNLQDVIEEVQVIPGDSTEVTAELKTAFAHAQPWIQRTRAILVSSHVFYKINYVIGSDKAHHLH